MSAERVLSFWFNEIDPSNWFKNDPHFDEQVKALFQGTYSEALAGSTASWRKTAKGRLAEVIVLDQFGRNIFRNTAQAFAGDELALNLAREAVRMGEDEMLSPKEKAFLYMPYMHSESKKMHQEAVKLFSQKGLEDNLKYEMMHKNIIDRFGRYPHRNKVLGRMSTPEEIEFLKQPNSSF
jgi:uncharacterized protein (DUF924 family)